VNSYSSFSLAESISSPWVLILILRLLTCPRAGESSSLLREDVIISLASLGRSWSMPSNSLGDLNISLAFPQLPSLIKSWISSLKPRLSGTTSFDFVVADIFSVYWFNTLLSSRSKNPRTSSVNSYSSFSLAESISSPWVLILILRLLTCPRAGESSSLLREDVIISLASLGRSWSMPSNSLGDLNISLAFPQLPSLIKSSISSLKPVANAYSLPSKLLSRLSGLSLTGLPFASSNSSKWITNATNSPVNRSSSALEIEFWWSRTASFNSFKWLSTSALNPRTYLWASFTYPLSNDFFITNERPSGRSFSISSIEFLIMIISVAFTQLPFLMFCINSSYESTYNKLSSEFEPAFNAFSIRTFDPGVMSFWESISKLPGLTFNILSKRFKNSKHSRVNNTSLSSTSTPASMLLSNSLKRFSILFIVSFIETWALSASPLRRDVRISILRSLDKRFSISSKTTGALIISVAFTQLPSSMVCINSSYKLASNKISSDFTNAFSVTTFNFDFTSFKSVATSPVYPFNTLSKRFRNSTTSPLNITSLSLTSESESPTLPNSSKWLSTLLVNSFPYSRAVSISPLSKAVIIPICSSFDKSFNISSNVAGVFTISTAFTQLPSSMFCINTLYKLTSTTSSLPLPIFTGFSATIFDLYIMPPSESSSFNNSSTPSKNLRTSRLNNTSLSSTSTPDSILLSNSLKWLPILLPTSFTYWTAVSTSPISNDAAIPACTSWGKRFSISYNPTGALIISVAFTQLPSSIFCISLDLGITSLRTVVLDLDVLFATSLSLKNPKNSNIFWL